jgi:hypothetical protein
MYLQIVCSNVLIFHYENNNDSHLQDDACVMEPLWVNEWVSEWSLVSANLAIFQLYHGKNKLIFNEMMTRSLSTRPTRLDGLPTVLAYWNNSSGIDMTPPTEKHYPDSETTSLCPCFFDLMLRTKQRSNKYKCHSLWVWPDRGSNPDLSHSRRAR